MDWTIIGIIASAIVSIGSFGLSIYNARVNRDTGEINNLRLIITTQGDLLKELEEKVDKLEKRDRTKTEAINTAYRCKKYQDKSECPVLAHILKL
jgi:hypothetical protein